MKFLLSLLATGALALTPTVVGRDAAGLATAQAALSSVIAANTALQMTIATFQPTDGTDAAADAINAVYTAIQTGTTNINAISVLADTEAYQLASLVPGLTGSTQDVVSATIGAKSRVVQACFGTLTYQVFTELAPLAQGFADALKSKVSTGLQGIVDSTGAEIQTQLQRGKAAYADQFPAPCQCADGCGSSSTTTSLSGTTESNSASITAGGGWIVITGTTVSSSAQTTTKTEAHMYSTISEDCDDDSTTTKATKDGWHVITGTTTTKAAVHTTNSDDCEDEYTTTKASDWEVMTKSTTRGSQHTTTKKSGSEWEVLSTSAPKASHHTTTKKSGSGWEVYTTMSTSCSEDDTTTGGKPTTSKAPGSSSGWQALTTTAKAPEHTTSPQTPAYTTPKAPVSSPVVVSSNSPQAPNTTPQAPTYAAPQPPASTTKAMTTQGPIASYTTAKAPVSSYAGAANAGAAMNIGAVLLAAGIALL